MKRTAIIATLLLLCYAHAGAQVNSSCLELWQKYERVSDSVWAAGPDSITVNPDSAMIDTCKGAQYGDEFAKTEFILRFQDFIFSDSNNFNIDDSGSRNWRELDPRFSAVRNGLDSIEGRFGPFSIYRIYPVNDSTNAPADIDTSSPLARQWRLSFLDYVNVDTAIYYLDSVPGEMWPVVCHDGLLDPEESEVPPDTALVPGLDFSKIALDGSSTFTRYLHPLGWEWHIYDLHVPMAWEITMGKPSIHVIGSDQFGTGDYGNVLFPDSSANPDLTPNFIQTINSKVPAPEKQFEGDGLPSSELKDGHGHGCISQAVAVVGKGPMIGTCPECTGIALDWTYTIKDRNGNPQAVYPDDIDVDGVVHNGIRVPEVEWSSASNSIAGPQSADYMRMVSEGMAIFCAAGNTLSDSEGGAGNYYEINPLDTSQMLLYPQSLGDIYGYTAFVAGKDPSKDVHPMAVGGSMDGHLWGPTGTSSCVENVGGSYVRCVGPEEFAVDLSYIPYGFSCGLDKFDTSSVVATRIERKTWAFMDVVAPAVLIMTANASTPGYGITNGTSESAPMVAGIAGLMRSVNYYVTRNDSIPSDLADVQRNINNIITFTADKIYDYDNTAGHTYQNSLIIPKGFPANVNDSAYLNGWLDPQTAGSGNWQYNYVNQTKDPLGRSWAQRVGFGRVNAYRAVANSIACNGSHIYNNSRDLTSDFFKGNIKNENGKYLMHFGAWQAPDGAPVDSVLTLVAGGKIVPNQSPAWPHLNQGETLLMSHDGSSTVLTVGDSDILAIDGIVKGDGLANNEITTAARGKILIAGYLQDVEVTGDTTKADDLIIYSSGTNGYGNVTVMHNQHSEIYGDVELQANGNFIVDGGTLTVQPGGEIDMEGNNDFEIVSGTVRMEASTTISSKSKEVDIDSGSILEIGGFLPVNILCTLHIKSGGIVIIDSGADLHLNQFVVDRGGTFTCSPGGRLTLNNANDNFCYGNFNFAGTAGNRISLTGHVSDCGLVDLYARILAIGNPAAQNNADLTMQYVDDSDVFIVGENIPKSVFLDDYFSANSSFAFTDQWYGSALLDISNSNNIVPGHSVSDVVLNECRFFDEAGTDSNHYFEGLETYDLANESVSSCQFYNLNTGIDTWFCPNAWYIGDKFGVNADPGSGASNAGQLQMGISDQFSASVYCSDTIANCTLGITELDDMFCTMSDNVFTGIPAPSWCLSAQNGGRYDLRNNSFGNYSTYGIFSKGFGNLLSLRDDDTLEYGRNTFSGLAGSADMVRWQNGELAAACGLNTFGALSNYQIYNRDAQILPIDLESNDWLGSVRAFDCIPIGAMLDMSGASAPDCDFHADQSQPVCGMSYVTIPSDRYPGTALWFTIDSSGPEIRSAFASARGMFLSDTNDANVRLTKARDELWAATRIDSSSVYFPIALGDLDSVIADKFVPDTLRSGVWMLKGQLEEMLGNPNLALACYDTVAEKYHQYSDSIYALWGTQRLSTIVQDTVTNGTDSAFRAFSHRKYLDLLAMIDTVPPPSAPVTGAANSGIQVTVFPNPAYTGVAILVENLPVGVSATVEIVNLLGQTIMTLFNAQPESELGLYLTFDCSALASANYFARVVSGGMRATVKFSVEH